MQRCKANFLWVPFSSHGAYVITKFSGCGVVWITYSGFSSWTLLSDLGILCRLVLQQNFFFKIFFGGHESFLWGHWYPCFGLLVTSPLGFKAKVGSALFALGGGVQVTLHIPWDSPLVLHLLTSGQPAWLLSWSLPHTCGGSGGSRTGDLSLHERTLNRLSYAGSALLQQNLKLIIPPLVGIEPRLLDSSSNMILFH